MATDVPQHLRGQLSDAEIDAFSAPLFGLYRAAADPDWKRCGSVYAECLPRDRRCIESAGHDGELHRNRAGFAWTDAEAHQSALAELARITTENEDYRALFDLQQTRMAAATTLWQQEDPASRAGVLPDLGELLGWLMAGKAAAERLLAEANARVHAVRKAAFKGFGEVRQALVEALGREDDHTTTQVAYVAELTAERDRARAELMARRVTAAEILADADKRKTGDQS